MKRHKILIVLGTRPELIKVAPIIQQLERAKDIYDVRICGTGQHKELVDPLLDLFNIQFDYDLKLMNPSQSSHRFLSRCIDELGQLMGSVNPHYVMVQGDTNSALAGALAAYLSLIHI